MHTNQYQAETLPKRVFTATRENFEQLALEVFAFQYHENPLYRFYSDLRKKSPDSVHTLADIPFLPITQFRDAQVRTTDFEPVIFFESSGTTGMRTARHDLKDISLYENSFKRCFELFYGPASDYCVLALLPSYLERGLSSLLYMADYLIRASGHPDSGFFLYNHDELASKLRANEAAGQKSWLLGVTYALLDFAQNYPMPLKHTMVMETGGMKGRREELTRDEVHSHLQAAFQTDSIHSEYGMTELLSQAYAREKGLFECPPWMKMLLRLEDDPSVIHLSNPGPKPLTGGINIIDLANLYSCSFLATDDAGRLHDDGRFEVLGRMDYADIRGCSLMIA